MARSIFREARSLFFLGLLIGVTTGSAAAQTVYVDFNGKASDGSPISGGFTYLQTKSPSGTGSGVFNFSHDSVDPYGLGYAITTQGTLSSVSKQGLQLSSFVITASNHSTTFVLQAGFGGTTSVTITLTLNVASNGNNLPAWNAFTTGSTGTCQQTVGSNTTSFTITVTSSGNVSAFSLPAPTHVVYENCAPVYFPVYACRPQPACCPFGLFQRRSCRIGCW
jgi:hypothetical protein